MVVFSYNDLFLPVASPDSKLFLYLKGKKIRNSHLAGRRNKALHQLRISSTPLRLASWDSEPVAALPVLQGMLLCLVCCGCHFSIATDIICLKCLYSTSSYLFWLSCLCGCCSGRNCKTESLCQHTNQYKWSCADPTAITCRLWDDEWMALANKIESINLIAKKKQELIKSIKSWGRLFCEVMLNDTSFILVVLSSFYL